MFDVLESGIDFLIPTLNSHQFIAHNSKFELTHLIKAGATFKDSIHCTMLMSQLINGVVSPVDEPDEDELDTPVGERDGLSAYKRLSNSLEACSIRWLSVAPSKEYQKSLWGIRPLSEEQIKYAALDSILTYELFRLFIQKLDKLNMLEIYKLQKKCLLPIAEMETRGICFDWTAHEKLIKRWKEEFYEADLRAKDIFGKTNLASPKQMREWLVNTFDKTIVNAWPKTKPSKTCLTGNLSFTATSLADFRHLPQIEALFCWKKLNKLLSTYGENLALKHKHPITSRLHTSFILGETATGRLSSRNPNLQNQPRDGSIRSLFIAPSGKVLIVADYSQIELRIQAELSQDPVMLKAYKDGEDLYKVLASSLYGVPIEKITKQQRTLGKLGLLSLGYGTGSKKLRSTARSVYDLELSEKEAFDIWTTYHNTFHVYSNWCNRVREDGEVLGYVTTLIGKKRKLVEDKIYTTAPNHIVQGTASELMQKALILALEYGLKLTLTIHDEIIVESTLDTAKKDVLLLENALNGAWSQMFPNSVCHHVADAFCGNTWAEAKEGH